MLHLGDDRYEHLLPGDPRWSDGLEQERDANGQAGRAHDLDTLVAGSIFGEVQHDLSHARVVDRELASGEFCNNTCKLIGSDRVIPWKVRRARITL